MNNYKKIILQYIFLQISCFLVVLCKILHFTYNYRNVDKRLIILGQQYIVFSMRETVTNIYYHVYSFNFFQTVNLWRNNLPVAKPNITSRTLSLLTSIIRIADSVVNFGSFMIQTSSVSMWEQPATAEMF